MSQERPRYLISTGYCPFSFGLTPEDAFKVAGQLTQERLGPVGVELYPTQSSFPFMELNAPQIKEWEGKYGAKAARVHLEFAYDNVEYEFQSSIRNNQHNNNHLKVFAAWFVYRSIKDAKSGFGLKLARELGIGFNAHTNVVLGFQNEGLSDELTRGIKAERLVENSIKYNAELVHPYMTGPVLWNPRIIVDKLLRDGVCSDLLFAYDHLTDYFDRQGLDPDDSIRDPKVQKRVRAIHISGPNHSVIKPGDPKIESFLKIVTGTGEIRKPVQFVFDYSPQAILRSTRRVEDRVQVFRDAINWFDSFEQK